MLDLGNISYECCPWPKGVMTLTQGHISKVKVTVHTYHNAVSGPKLQLSYWFWIILETIVVNDPKGVIQDHISKVKVTEHA